MVVQVLVSMVVSMTAVVIVIVIVASVVLVLACHWVTPCVSSALGGPDLCGPFE
jgi:hypothetical protein